MSSTDESTKRLVALLRDKKLLYDQMIIENKEFDEVKALFLEIKALEQQLANLSEQEQ